MPYPSPVKLTGGTPATADANYPSNSGVLWEGGSGTFVVYGTPGGATAKLQAKSPLGSTWVDVPSASFTASGMGTVTLGDGFFVRMNVASSSGSTSLSAEILYNTK